MLHKKGEIRGQLKMVCFDELVDSDSPARQIDAFVNNSNTSYFKHAKTNATGRPPYDPKDMLKLYLYGLENNIISSRKLEKACQINVEAMWLLNGLTPESKTICNFRKNNTNNLVRFFKEFCLTLKNNGLIDGKLMAIDGTKIRANNSKKNNFSKTKLTTRIKEIDNKIEQYIDDIDHQDKVERLKARKRKYEELQENMEEEDVKEISLTDSDARMMQNPSNAYEVSYNVQSVVDSKNKLIAGMEVVNQSNDQGQLGKVMPKVKEELELEETTVLADKGYYKTEDFKTCEDNNITSLVCPCNKVEQEIYDVDEFTYDEENDVIICPAYQELFPGKIDKAGFKEYKNGRACKSCLMKNKCTRGKRRVIKRHVNKASAERNDTRYNENINLYLTRQSLVEHPFGTVKRTMGIRQFLTRGLESVSAEIALIFTCYNLKRLRVIHNNNPKNTPIALFLTYFVLNLTFFLNINTLYSKCYKH